MARTNILRAGWFRFAVAMVVLVNLTVFLDIPVLRQISAFIFLSFVPGFLILAALRPGRLGQAEQIALSVGLSVAFTMAFGLALNSASLALGYAHPLSTGILAVSFSLATGFFIILAYLRNRDITLPFLAVPALTSREKALLVLPSFFPLLSLIGMRIMNMDGDNRLLMLLLLLIAGYVIFIVFYARHIPERLYPGILWLMGISLMLMLAMRSNHILGSDVHDAFYIFQRTLENQHWRVLSPGLVESLLSISLVPTIFQVFLNAPPEHLFRILYPLLFSVSPLVVYVIARKYVSGPYAFMGTFFFMSQVLFLWSTGASNFIMAQLFFALSVMAMFHTNMNEFAKKLLYVIFAFSAVVSHYSTAYIFFFLLILTWLGSQAIRLILISRRPALPEKQSGANSHTFLPGFLRTEGWHFSTDPPAPLLKRSITVTMVALLFCLVFFWYSQVTPIAFKTGLGIIFEVFANLNQGLVMESKDATVTAALGQAIFSIPQKIRSGISWLAVALIALGVLATALRFAKMAIKGNHRNPERRDGAPGKQSPQEPRFEIEYLVLSLACSLILLSAVVLPYVSKYYGVERPYFQSLVILSPFLVIGGALVNSWLKARAQWLLVLVLVPYFLCTTGVTYQIFGIPAALALNSAGSEYQHLYVNDKVSYAAKWLSEHAQAGLPINTDYGLGPRILASQGQISTTRVRGEVVGRYQKGEVVTGYLFLFHPEVIRGEAPLPEGAQMQITPSPGLLSNRNKTYTTGANEIYGPR